MIKRWISPGMISGREQRLKERKWKIRRKILRSEKTLIGRFSWACSTRSGFEVESSQVVIMVRGGYLRLKVDGQYWDWAESRAIEVELGELKSRSPPGDCDSASVCTSNNRLPGAGETSLPWNLNRLVTSSSSASSQTSWPSIDLNSQLAESFHTGIFIASWRVLGSFSDTYRYLSVLDSLLRSRSVGQRVFSTTDS